MAPENAAELAQVQSQTRASPAITPGTANSHSTEMEDDSPTPTWIERDYTTTKDADDRIDIMYELADDGSPEAVRTLGRLLQVETDPDLKMEILAALESVDEEIDLKLAIFARTLHSDQTPEVRQAAADSLETIVDSRAIPVWKTLLKDRDSSIRADAKQQIEYLQSPDSQ